MGYDYPMMNNYGWGWGVGMMVFWLVTLAVVAIVVLRLLKSHEHGTRSGSDPIGIAKERYAKGEINREEFEQLKKDLK
jgi:putative membrane protein